MPSIALALILFLGPGNPCASAPLPDSETALRVVLALDLVGDEYDAGVVDGLVVDRVEYEESSIFLKEALKLIENDAGLASLSPTVHALLSTMDAVAPSGEVLEILSGLRAEIESRVGHPLIASLPEGVSLSSGKRLFATHCQGCHSENPTLPLEGFDPPLFTSDFLSDKSPSQLFTAVSMGIAGTPMQPWSEPLSPSDRWSIVLALWALAGEEEVERGRGLIAQLSPLSLAEISLALPKEGLLALPDDSLLEILSLTLSEEEARDAVWAMRLSSVESIPELDQVDPLVLLRIRLDDLLARVDQPTFSAEVLSLYLEVFEPLEPSLMAQDPSWTLSTERAFHALLQAAETDRFERTANLQALLSQDRLSQGSPLPPKGIIISSLTIILREGAEAFLIIAVLLGLIRRTGRKDLLPSLWGGISAALLGTGGLALWAKNALSSADAEILEGATMLLAAGVLLGVSLWFWTKSARGLWEKELAGKVEAASAQGSTWAIGGIAFLTVFREGFETVLFYRALIAFTDAPTLVWTGFLIGVALLAVAGFLILRVVRSFQVGSLFQFTSLFLFVMAFAFAGQGVAELQEGGLLPLSPLRGAPSMPVLGINPTWEGSLVQSAILFLGLWGWKRMRQKPPPPSIQSGTN